MNSKMAENVWGGVFPDEESFNKIFDACMDNAPQAPEQVRTAYMEMYSAFERYLDAIEEYKFRHAYQCGYEAAVQQAGQIPAYLQRGGAAV